MDEKKIKNRLLKKAAKTWGYDEIEVENSFDPIVTLLINAIASELEKLYFELDNSNSRIIDRIINIIFPEQVSGVKPAITLLKAEPTEQKYELSIYDNFRYQYQIANIYNPTEPIIKETHFAPSQNITLNKTTLKFIAYSDKIIEYDEENGKSIKNSLQNYENGKFWIGFENESIDFLDKLQLFFDTQTSYYKEVFFHYLPQAEIKYNNKNLKFKSGYNNTENEVNLENLTKNYIEIDQCLKEANEYYKRHFYYIELDPKTDYAQDDGSQSIPPPHEDKDIHWIQFTFNESISNEIFENLIVQANVFPIVNIKKEKSTLRLSDVLNFRQLITQDHFLDVDKIMDDTGVQYQIHQQETNANTAVLRKGGVSRFSEENASEAIQYILQLLKDETASFSSLGSDIIKQDIQEINKNINALYQKAKEKEFLKTSNPYVIIYPKNPENNALCTVNFWSTLGDQGNNINSFTPLTVDDSNFEKNAITLYPTEGGRKSLNSHDKVKEFRTALLTRGKIVTMSDIQSFGYSHFKQYINNIEIKKGIQKDISSKQGFSRSINIKLIHNPEEISKITKTEWDYLTKSFLLKLENKSAALFPYILSDDIASW